MRICVGVYVVFLCVSVRVCECVYGWCVFERASVRVMCVLVWCVCESSSVRFLMCLCVYMRICM